LNGYVPNATFSPQDVWDTVDKTKAQRDYVLVLRNIDSDWCEALCTKYPGAIDRMFLLEHILGIDLQLDPESFYQAPYNSCRMLKEGLGAAMDPFSINLMDNIHHTTQQVRTHVNDMFRKLAQTESLGSRSHGVHVN
jgi:hypothetical protein